MNHRCTRCKSGLQQTLRYPTVTRLGQMSRYPSWCRGGGSCGTPRRCFTDQESSCLGWLSEACRLHLKPHLAAVKLTGRFENNSGCCCCCCCCCFALILLAGFHPSCWLLCRKHWLGMHHRCCHPKISKPFILPPLFTLNSWPDCIFGVIYSHLWLLCHLLGIYSIFLAANWIYWRLKLIT